MRKIVLLTLVFLGLMFTGCSSKDAEVVPVQVEVVEVAEATIDQGAIDKRNIESLDSVYFGFDKYSVTDDVQAKNNSFVAKDVESVIVINGNTDEWGTDEYNYALGLKRANAVKESMVFNGVNPENLKLITHGESNPVCTEKTKDCFAKNRRVDFTSAD